MDALLVLDALVAAVRAAFGTSAFVQLQQDVAVILMIKTSSGLMAAARGSDVGAVIYSAAREFLARSERETDARGRLATLITIDDYRRRAKALRRASENAATEDAQARAASLLESAREFEAAAAAAEKQFLLEDA